MDATLNIPVQAGLLELARVLGEPAVIVSAALRQYVVDRCLQRIDEAERKNAFYVQQYATDYEAFSKRVATDPVYLAGLNRENPLWEADAIEWALRLEEAEAWRNRLQQALRTSFPSPVTA